jgi:hypothetical protein
MMKLMKIGDRVMAKMDKEARSYRSEYYVPDGRKGTIVSIVRGKRILDVFGSHIKYGLKPGIYSANTSVMVQWDFETGDPREVLAPMVADVYSTYLVDPELEKQRYDELWPVKNADGSFNIEFDMIKADYELGEYRFERELPPFKFWPRDVVNIEASFDDVTEKYPGCYALVTSANFHWQDDENDELTYNVQFFDSTGKSLFGTSCRESHLSLVKRGPLYCEIHGIEYEFKDDVDKLSHETFMERANEIRNPNCGLYRWTIGEAVSFIRSGKADVIRYGSTLGLSQRVSVYKCEDEELGKRIREVTIEGWKNTEFDETGEPTTLPRKVLR